jgi:hypothetical protein
MTVNYFLLTQIAANSPIGALSGMKGLAMVENVLYSPSPNRKSTVAYESCFYIGITLTTLPKASLIDQSARHEQMRFNFGICTFALKLNLPWNYARLGSHHEIMAVIVVKDDRGVCVPEHGQAIFIAKSLFTRSCGAAASERDSVAVTD